MIAVECHGCEASEFDGLDGAGLFWPPAGWEGIEMVGSEFLDYPTAWATHQGWCPECVATGKEEAENADVKESK